MKADERFDKAAAIYDALSPHYRDYGRARASYIGGVDRAIVSRLEGKAAQTLDFGAGDGIRGANLFEKLGGNELVQADVSGEMLKLCRQLGKAKQTWDVREQGWANRSERFDVVLCLWNVLGHIPSPNDRIEVLKQLKGLLKPGGTICFDVNNRHNFHYGKLRVLFRILVDWILPDTTRGDVEFDWEVGDRKYPAYGHLFTKAETQSLVEAAGLEVIEWLAVNYNTGSPSHRKTDGQLLFFVRKKEDSP